MNNHTTTTTTTTTTARYMSPSTTGEPYKYSGAYLFDCLTLLFCATHITIIITIVIVKHCAPC